MQYSNVIDFLIPSAGFLGINFKYIFFLFSNKVLSCRDPLSCLRLIMKKDIMDNLPEHKSSKIAIFKGKQILKAIPEDEWYFSIIDIIEVLTESSNARRYWSDLKSKLIENEGFSQ